jgi:hypothetical protein
VWTLTRDTALVEQAEQAAPANALCRAPASGAVNVWRTVVRARSVRMLSARLWNSSFPVLMNPTSASSAPLKAFANTRSVAVAASLLSAT